MARGVEGGGALARHRRQLPPPRRLDALHLARLRRKPASRADRRTARLVALPHLDRVAPAARRAADDDVYRQRPRSNRISTGPSRASSQRIAGSTVMVWPCSMTW